MSQPEDVVQDYKKVPAVLSERCAQCHVLIDQFRQMRHEYETANEDTAPVYRTILLQLIAEIGEHVAYIRDYHGQVLKQRSPDFAFILPHIRNVIYHNQQDIGFNLGKLNDKGINLGNGSRDEIIAFIISPECETFLQEAATYNVDAEYIRTLYPPPPVATKGLDKRLEMVHGELQSTIWILEQADKLDPYYINKAVDFHLARFSMAYEDYQTELNRLIESNPYHPDVRSYQLELQFLAQYARQTALTE